MKTQDAKDTSHGTQIPAPHRRRNASWLAGTGAVLVVLLLIGVSVFVFTQARQHATNSAVQPPPTGRWTAVLQGYALNSIVAARNNPAMLYACAMPSQSSTISTSVPGAPAQGNSGTSQHFTVLHSTDFGAHWQTVSGNISLGYACQIAVNPADGNDVYATGTSTGNAPTGVLFHSTDGGQTWATIKPTLSIPGSSHLPAWSVQQISVEGGRLFGIQFVQSGGPVPLQPRTLPLSRLVTSVDGGKTWTILDAKLASTNMNARDYAIDPSNVAIIYELLGPTYGPIQPATGAPTGSRTGSAYGIEEALYKSTDGGASWKMLLNKLPFGTQVRLAANAPNILYAGGSRSPLPYVASGAEPAVPLQAGNFLLHISNDGGATWRNVPDLPSSSSFVVNWFVSAGGQVYAYSPNGITGSGSSTPGVQATAIATAVPPVPPVATPRTAPGTSSVSSSSAALSALSSQSALTIAASGSAKPTATILRYDPTSNAWSELTKAPVTGLLLAVTPANPNGGSVLWLLGDNNGKVTLYRYVA
jgi:BNR/Asp-box repeat